MKYRAVIKYKRGYLGLQRFIWQSVKMLALPIRSDLLLLLIIEDLGQWTWTMKI